MGKGWRARGKPERLEEKPGGHCPHQGESMQGAGREEIGAKLTIPWRPMGGAKPIGEGGNAAPPH